MIKTTLILWDCSCTECLVYCHRLEMVVESLLSTFEGTELGHNVSSVLPLIEKSIGIITNNTQAQNGKNATKQQGCGAAFVLPGQG